jgi:hypothetical protein
MCVLVAGCSSSGDTGPPAKGAVNLEDDEAAAILEDARKMGSPQQAEALADGHISVEEMEASFEAWEACLASTHFHLEDVSPDPIRGEPHFNYAVGPDRPDRDPAEADDCDIRTHRFVEVFAQVIQRSGPMDPALRARTHSCLDDAGVPTSPGDRTDIEIFVTAGRDHKDNVVACMEAAFRAEFPDREPISAVPPPEVMDR